MKILLAEDSAASRYLLQRAVEDLGHECVVAQDGLEAWERYGEVGPEVVISDWIMPGLDGDELCRRIRADPGAPYTYFVMLTSLEDKEHVLRGMQAGVDDYLTKPLDRHELGARLIAASRVTALHRQVVAQRRELESEIAMAAGIQRGLLPAEPPWLPGLDLAGLCLPAANVGGDYYDLIAVEDRLAVLIADVAGHSIGSALLMAMARSALRHEVALGRSPGAVLAATNEAMHADLVTAGLFITMFCAIYDPSDARLTYANAGHTPPLVARAAGPIEELDADGAAIGFLPGVDFEERETTLEPGDTLVLHTDGVTEALDPEGEPFGEERLAAAVAEHAGAGAGVTLDAVVAAVSGFTAGADQRDDITMVAVRRHG